MAVLLFLAAMCRLESPLSWSCWNISVEELEALREGGREASKSLSSEMSEWDLAAKWCKIGACKDSRKDER